MQQPLPPLAPMFGRHAEPLILDALQDTRVVMVLGARQVGKTTLTQDIAGGPHRARILSLDDQATRNAAANDPTSFIAGLSGPTLIDEVQRVPDLLFAIKKPRSTSTRRRSGSCSPDRRTC